MGKAVIEIPVQIFDRSSRKIALTSRLQRYASLRRPNCIIVQMNKWCFQGTCLPQTLDYASHRWRQKVGDAQPCLLHSEEAVSILN
jgi:hypothetical protein